MVYFRPCIWFTLNPEHYIRWRCGTARTAPLPSSSYDSWLNSFVNRWNSLQDCLHVTSKDHYVYCNSLLERYNRWRCWTARSAPPPISWHDTCIDLKIENRYELLQECIHVISQDMTGKCYWYITSRFYITSKFQDTTRKFHISGEFDYSSATPGEGAGRQEVRLHQSHDMTPALI